MAVANVVIEFAKPLFVSLLRSQLFKLLLRLVEFVLLEKGIGIVIGSLERVWGFGKSLDTGILCTYVVGIVVEFKALADVTSLVLCRGA